MKPLYTRSLALSVALGLVACAAQSADSGSSANALVDDEGALTLADVGETATAKVTVSGSLHAENGILPNNPADRCNAPRTKADQPGSNYAYVELKNPSASARSVDLKITGSDLATTDLIAFASNKAPKDAATGGRCLTVAHGSTLDADKRVKAITGGPRLTSARGTGVVVPAKGSVYVMVATAEATGTYTLTAKSEADSEAADSGTILLTSKKTTSLTALVSGSKRVDKGVLPNSPADKCKEARGAYTNPASNYAYVELKNASANPQSVDLKVVGNDLFTVSLIAYSSSTAPKLDAEATKCLTLAHGAKVEDDKFKPIDGGPSLEALIVPAKSSTYVLLSTLDDTGAYTIKATSDGGGDEDDKDAGTIDAGKPGTSEKDAGGSTTTTLQSDAGDGGTDSTQTDPPATGSQDDWMNADSPGSQHSGSGDEYSDPSSYSEDPSEEDDKSSTKSDKSANAGGCSTTGSSSSQTGGVSILASVFAAIGLGRRRRNRRAA